MSAVDEDVTGRIQAQVLYAQSTVAEMMALVREIGGSTFADADKRRLLQSLAIDIIDNLRAIDRAAGDCNNCKSTEKGAA